MSGIASRRTLAAAAVVAVAGGTLVTAVHSGAAEAGDRTFTITDSRNGAGYAFIDHAPRSKHDQDGTPARTSIGDEVTLINRLTTSSGGKDHGYYHCTVLAAVPSAADRLPALCVYDLVLPAGHLTGSGEINFYANRSVIAVTGGTGAYAGARGTIVRVEGPESQNGGTQTIRLTD